MLEKKIIYSDKTTNKVTIFTSKEESKITLICLPAMGVRASFYKRFAETLSLEGFNVITADWRGQGNSSVRASRKVNFGYSELIGDIKELAEQSNSWFPNTKKLIIGHSLGGQAGSLFMSRFPEYIDGLVLITSGSVFYKGWKGSEAVKLYSVGHLFYPISKTIGYFPGNVIGFGGREARNIIKDWSYNVISGKYKLSGSSYNYENSLSELEKPTLAISIEKDYLASKKSTENLYGKFNSNSRITHLHLSENQTKITPLNHFSWAKKPEYFVNLIIKWLNQEIK